MDKSIEELRKTESVDEANQLLSDGWVLLQSNSTVINGEAVYFFLFGKPRISKLQKALQELNAEE